MKRLTILPLALLTAACAGMTPPPPPAPAPISAYDGPPSSPAVATPNRESGQSVANPNQADFERYLVDLRGRALGAGVSPRTWEAAMRGVKLNMRTIELSSGASGGMGRAWVYLERVNKLLGPGRGKVAANRAPLDAAARRTGVDPMAIAAIWGNETSYGGVLGSFYVPEALASLAYEGRRRAFFEEELVAALSLMERGLVSRDELTGSYAGALGQVQFMPSNILKLGMDGDGDGHRDLRGSLADAFLSCGNYLKAHGWRTGEPWLAEIVTPPDFRWESAGPDIVMTVADWDAAGVRLADGRRIGAIIRPDAPASVILPAGHRGVKLIAFENYRRFLDYNPSQSYAIAVGHLANRLNGEADFRGSWPTDLAGMTMAEMKEMQTHLMRLGHDVGPDGRFGDKTRRAVRAYQLSAGLPADGYPTRALLDHLRREVLS